MSDPLLPFIHVQLDFSQLGENHNQQNNSSSGEPSTETTRRNSINVKEIISISPPYPQTIHQLIDQSFYKQFPELSSQQREQILDYKLFGIRQHPTNTSEEFPIFSDVQLTDFLASLLSSCLTDHPPTKQCDNGTDHPSRSPNFHLVITLNEATSSDQINSEYSDEEVKQLKSSLGLRFALMPTKLLMKSLKDLSDDILSSVTDAFITTPLLDDSPRRTLPQPHPTSQPTAII